VGASGTTGGRPGGEPSTSPRSQCVCVGVVTGAQGVRGAVRVKSFTAVPEDIGNYGPLESENAQQRFTLEVVGAAKGVLIARLSGVKDRDAAEALRGLRLYLPRVALPPTDADEYYHADLIGLAALLPDGGMIGRVRAVHDFGAGDTLEIERPDTSPVLVPFTRAVVPVVDMAAGRLVVDPPPGLLEPVSSEADREPSSAGLIPEDRRVKPGHDKREEEFRAAHDEPAA